MSHKGEIQTKTETNSGEAEDHHVIEIGELMEKKILEQPKLLRTSAGRSSCCVFRVFRNFVDTNGPNAYQPEFFSIGPYHHRKSHDSHLQMLEEHKWRYLGSLVSRTERAKGVGLVDYLKAIQSLESEARDCYSETIELTTDEFVEMMVLDGCFVIELFRKRAGVVPIEEDDPIFSMYWLPPCLVRDILKLENQIPLFILQSLFDLSKIPGDRIPREERDASLARLSLRFFDGPIPMPEKVVLRAEKMDTSSKDKCPKHLLDFIRSSFIPDDQEPPKNLEIQMIPCATNLRRAGIKCKSNTGPKNSNLGTRMIHCVTKLCRAVIRCKSNTGDSPSKKSFLDIKFRKHGVIEMPTISMDDVTTSFLLNCVVYEQCHKTLPKHAYFTTYVAFMDFLINTAEDVGLLCDDQVIENLLGGDAEVAQFFNKSTRDVTADFGNGYLSKVFDDINEYYRTNWNVQWATFHHKYFDSPWSFISLIAAVFLLFLTISQTFFAAYDYYQSRKG